MTISVFLSGSQTLERHNNYYIESMPGSYRSITSTLEKTSPDNAKADLSAVSESQEEEMEPSRECQDGKWTL